MTVPSTEKVASDCRPQDDHSFEPPVEPEGKAVRFYGFSDKAVRSSLKRSSDWAEAVISWKNSYEIKEKETRLSVDSIFPKSLPDHKSSRRKRQNRRETFASEPCHRILARHRPISDRSQNPQGPLPLLEKYGSLNLSPKQAQNTAVTRTKNTFEKSDLIELKAIDIDSENIDVHKNLFTNLKSNCNEELTKPSRSPRKRRTKVPSKYRTEDESHFKTAKPRESPFTVQQDPCVAIKSDPSPPSDIEKDDLDFTVKICEKTHSKLNNARKRGQEPSSELPNKRLKLETHTDDPSPRRSKQIRCKKCDNCQKSNCGKCRQCLNMPMFGGPGNLRHGCIQRKCLRKTKTEISSKKTVDAKTLDQEKLSKKKKSVTKTNVAHIKEKKNLSQESMKSSSTTFEKPKLSRSSLMYMAIKNSKEKKLTFTQMKDYIIQKFPSFQNEDKAVWQGFRQTLCHCKAFVRDPSNKNGRVDCFWSIDPDWKFRSSIAKLSNVGQDLKPNTKSGFSNDLDPDLEADITSPYIPERLIPEQIIENLKQEVSDSPRTTGEQSTLKDVPEVLQRAIVTKKVKENVYSSPFMGCVDFSEHYDPDVVKDFGQAVIVSQESDLDWLCFLCGSAGVEELVFCRTCCEPFHPFCKDPNSIVAFTNDGGVQCGRCSMCHVCNLPSAINQVTCKKCDKAFDRGCLSENAQELIDAQLPNWLCPACLRCGSCGAANVTTFDPTEKLQTLQAMCASCNLQHKKGSFCPLCKGSYDDDDYDTRMVECSICYAWVHALCNEINEESYQVLSFLPETIEFVCRNCHKDDNKLPDWQSAVESEKKASRLAIVESLLKCPLSKYFFKSDMLVKFKSDDTFTKSSSCDKKVQNTDDFERSNHELLTTELDGVKKEEEEAEREMQKTLESLDKQNVQKTNPEIASSSSSSNKLETFGNKTCSPIRQHSNLSLVNKVASPESIRAKEALFSGRPILTKAIVVPLKFCLNGSLKTPPYEVRDLPFSYYEKHYDLKRCSIVVERFKEKEIPIQEPRIKECVISVNDIKHHSWWGPKVTQLCGAEPKNSESANVTPQKHQSHSSPSKEISFSMWKSPERKNDSKDILPAQGSNQDLDLNKIFDNVNNNVYEHITQLHFDIKRVIENSCLRGPNRSKILKSFIAVYEKSVQEVCPWFNLNNIQAFFDQKQGPENAIEPPSLDHEYSDFSLKRLNRRSNVNSISHLLREKYPPTQDNRICKLCGKQGDAHSTRAGRLLHLRLDEWVHISCALWSSEVYEEVDGSLQNISQAIKRGTKLQCTFCGMNGATIGCCSENCKCNYHFECGLADGAAFKEDKTVFCQRHKHQSNKVPITKDFRIQRTVHLEDDSKKKSKLVDLRSVRVHIGSMLVEALGTLHPVASDSKTVLVPVGFTCSRYYWSTKNPTRLARYRFRTKLQYPSKSSEVDILPDKDHLVIDHTCMENEDIDKKVVQFQKFCRKIDLKYCKRMSKYTNILPPVFANSIWNHLNYEKLHPEWNEKFQLPKNSESDDCKKLRSGKNGDNPAPMTSKVETMERTGNCEKPTNLSCLEDTNLDCSDERKTPIVIDSNENTSSVKTVKTWFNQLKQIKLSEVIIQCDLPFNETNFDVDFEEEVRNSMSVEIEDEPLIDNDDLVDIDEIIMKESASPDILLNCGELSFEPLPLKADESLRDLLDIVDLDDNFENSTIEDIQLCIGQLDGAVDEGDDDTNEEKEQKYRAQTPANEDHSPRKDFSIAGLLSPSDANKSSATSTPSSTPKPSTPQERPLSVAPTSSQALGQHRGNPGHAATPAPAQQILSFANQSSSSQPSVFIQHLPTAAQTPSFAQSFEQATGRPLQYLASVSNFAELASFSHLQSPLHMSTQGVIQPLGSPYPGFVSPHIGFVGPQNILVNPHLSYLNYAAAATQQPTVVYNPSQFPSYASGTGGFLQPPPPPPTPSRLYANSLLYPQLSVVNPFSTGNISSGQFHDRLAYASTSLPGTKKVARVQPQPWIRKADTPSPSSSVSSSPLMSPVSSRSGKSDPLKALSSMASSPMASSSKVFKSSSLSISHSHGSDKVSRSSKSPHRSVGTQAKIGGPLKIMTPRPWREVDDPLDHFKRVPLPLSSETMSSGVSVESSSANSLYGSRPSSNSSSADRSTLRLIAESALSSPEIQNEEPVISLGDGSKLISKRSNADSIEITLKRKSDQHLEVERLVIKENVSRSNEAIDPSTAIKALKAKTKLSRKPRWRNEAAIVVPLDKHGNILHTPDQFLNEQEIMSGSKVASETSGLKGFKPFDEEDKPDGPFIIYELTSDDGYKSESSDHSTLWAEVFEAVQEARLLHGLELDVVNPLGKSGIQMMGLANSALAFLLEQLPGASTTKKYKFRHFDMRAEEEDIPVVPNESGCARTETYKGRKPIDMFSWLASRHRTIPKIFSAMLPLDAKLQLSSSRRATTLDLPMAMRFRHLASSAKEALDVFKSGIEGRGLFCKREIQMGEMVIEYAGECIRSILTDKREKYYEARGIGCYMFKIDDDTVVDATMKGNAARFINHSCDPNCYSKIVDVFGKKHIIIFAHRKIDVGEELTYDYKFPFEDVKIPCRCGAKRCRKYMN